MTHLMMEAVIRATSLISLTSSFSLTVIVPSSNNFHGAAFKHPQTDRTPSVKIKKKREIKQPPMCISSATIISFANKRSLVIHLYHLIHSTTTREVACILAMLFF
ncbi:unnamed protein product [Vicia faba]|uniref:Secreted protein n=1 Tax=Vicia faba TaxID=3906 RepID=A0AAV0Z9C4_VICFA|nr:unnamed protein product [Vicia faba]